jgi:PST family polysaccharide transporter
LIFAGLFIRPLQVVDYWFQAHLRAKQATLARNGALLVMAVARCGLVVAKAPIWTFALAMTVEISIATILQLVIYAHSSVRGPLGWRISAVAFRRLGRQSAPLVAASLSVIIYMRIDQLMLGALSARAENGLYAVATSLSEVSYFLPVALMSSLTPALTSLHHRDPTGWVSRLEHVFVLLTALGYATLVGSLLVARPLIHALFGPRYAGTVTPFLILCISIPFVFIGVAQNVWNILENHQMLSLVRAIVGSVLNVGLNFLLLPRYGAVGAAITTVVAQITASFAGNAIARTTWPMLRIGARALLLVDLVPAIRWAREVVLPSDSQAAGAERQ